MTDKLKALALEILAFHSIEGRKHSPEEHEKHRARKKEWRRLTHVDAILALIKRAEDAEAEVASTQRTALEAIAESQKLHAEIERLNGYIQKANMDVTEAYIKHNTLQTKVKRLNTEKKKDADTMLRLIADIRYVAGIAERGRGKPLQDAEKFTDCVLNYVKSLEARVNAMEERLYIVYAALGDALFELKVGNTYTTATDSYKANNELIHCLDTVMNGQYVSRSITPGAAPEPTMYRLMHKEGAAWIPASEWMTEADPSWVKLAQDKPDEWCIKEPLDGKKVADAFRAAFAQAAPKEPLEDIVPESNH